MGRKKKTQVFVLKPWCWYCEREFEDDKVLLQHQKSKHFKCQLCPRKLNTAGGLMVHSQQVHKCEPEPLTNTLPGRDGYDIEIFGMEGVPTNALAEWKARKETEAGSAALAVAAAAKRPRMAYTVIPEADLQAALAQHKALMAKRNNPLPPSFPPPFFPNGAMSLPPGFPPGYGMPPQTMPQAGPPPGMPGFMPPFPPNGVPPMMSPAPNTQPSVNYASAPYGMPPPSFASVAPALAQPDELSERDTAESQGVAILPPKDGVIWPDNEATPAEKRARQPRYRYQSPTPSGIEGDEFGGMRKRKAAADFL